MSLANTDREEDVALRCRALTQLYAGGNSSKFAEDFGLGQTQWNNIESTGKLSKEAALKIVRKRPAVSLDWLWLGNVRGLTATQESEFQAAVADAVAALNEPKRGRRKVPTKHRAAS